MTLRAFLSTLKTKATVTVKDSEDNEICKISADSVAALADDLEERTINRWYINGATAISLVLNDATISA